MKKGLIYLASPYSDPDPEVMEWRFQQVCKAAAQLMREGHLVFSPIAHTHPIAMAGALPTGWDFWQRYDEAMINACDRMIILRLPGYSTSTGVRAEWQYARETGRPVAFMAWAIEEEK